jgi:hypothetical protein
LKIEDCSTGIKIDNDGSKGRASINLDNNDIVTMAGGAGIVFNAGPGATTAHFLDNSITTHGNADGIVLEAAGRGDTFSFARNQISTTDAGDAIRVSGNAQGQNVLIFSGNRLSARTPTPSPVEGSVALNVTLSTSSDALIEVTGNELSSSDLGTGLVLQGGPAIVAKAQDNNFEGNRVGVKVLGDGTTAGDVDLGGGLPGSAGGNDFTSYREVDQPHFYAIGLFNVAPGYTMHAMSDKFTLSPSLVIADGSHDPHAGGSGVIFTSGVNLGRQPVGHSKVT